MAGLTEVRLIADCIGECFRGDPVKIADAAGIFVRFREMDAPLGVVYYSPTAEAPAGSIIVNRHAANHRPRLVALGLAHHMLRHREHRPYVWSLDGPIECDWRSEIEAREFAAALLQRAPMLATRRA